MPQVANSLVAFRPRSGLPGPDFVPLHALPGTNPACDPLDRLTETCGIQMGTMKLSKHPRTFPPLNEAKSLFASRSPERSQPRRNLFPERSQPARAEPVPPERSQPARELWSPERSQPRGNLVPRTKPTARGRTWSPERSQPQGGSLFPRTKPTARGNLVPSERSQTGGGNLVPERMPITFGASSPNEPRSSQKAVPRT